MREDTLKAINQTLSADDSTERFEALIEVLDREFQSDDESWRMKGYHLLRCFICDKSGAEAVDDALIALTGWSVETLMKKAHLIADDEGEEMVASYVIRYTDETEASADVNVNTKTREILDFVGEYPPFDKEKEIDGEYIRFYDIECAFAVIPEDQKEADEDLIHFWYGENF